MKMAINTYLILFANVIVKGVERNGVKILPKSMFFQQLPAYTRLISEVTGNNNFSARRNENGNQHAFDSFLQGGAKKRAPKN